MRREASAPNSPRDSGVGVVMPRAMKPDWVSKSKVRQTMWRGMGVLSGWGRAGNGCRSMAPARASANRYSRTVAQAAELRRSRSVDTVRRKI